MKGVMPFGKKEKLNPHCIGLFEILERICSSTFRIINGSRCFHVSMIKKFVVLTQEPIQVNQDLSYEKKLLQILDKKEKELRNKKIFLVKVL